MRQAQPQRLIIAIDGPSGAGKSTVARAVASALGLRYLDTGAMYRGLTWLALRDKVPIEDATGLGALAERARIEAGTDPDGPTIQVDGVDVATDIRGDLVTAAVSAVSAVPAVRAAMVRRQREAIGDGGIVVEGRDIGTAVAPEATVKVYLTADPAERAQRRAGELGARVPVVATQAAMSQRDASDAGRAASPLARAADATVIDSTGVSVDEVVARVLSLIPAGDTGP